MTGPCREPPRLEGQQRPADFPRRPGPTRGGRQPARRKAVPCPSPIQLPRPSIPQPENRTPAGFERFLSSRLPRHTDPARAGRSGQPRPAGRPERARGATSTWADPAHRSGVVSTTLQLLCMTGSTAVTQSRGVDPMRRCEAGCGGTVPTTNPDDTTRTATPAITGPRPWCTSSWCVMHREWPSPGEQSVPPDTEDG